MISGFQESHSKIKFNCNTKTDGKDLLGLKYYKYKKLERFDLKE